MRTAKGFAILVALLLSQAGHSESLEAAWETALAVDHSLRAAHLTTASEEERLGAARSRRLPTLNVEGGYVSKSDPSIVDISELNLSDAEQFSLRPHRVKPPLPFRI
jgi:outer membrane protein TolC